MGIDYSFEAAKALQLPPTQYTSSDVTAARNRWLDARQSAHQAMADLGEIQMKYARMSSSGRVSAVEKASARLANAREEADEAEETFHTILREAGHLEAMQSNQDQIAQLEKDRQAMHLIYANEQEQAFKSELQPRYLHNGGTEAEFESAFPRIWKAELERRSLAGRDLAEEKYAAEGRYGKL